MPATVTLKGIWAAAIALAFAFVLALLAIQTVRIEGFPLWPVSVEGWKPRAERLQKLLDAVPAAQLEARRKAEAAKTAHESTYRTIAKEVDADADEQERGQMAAADRYIAAHRVRPQGAADRGCGAGAASAGDRTRDGQAPGSAAELDDPGGDRGAADARAAAGMVAVSEADVRICTVNTIQAEAARTWALELEAASALPPSAPAAGH